MQRKYLFHHIAPYELLLLQCSCNLYLCVILDFMSCSYYSAVVIYIYNVLYLILNNIQMKIFLENELVGHIK